MKLVFRSLLIALFLSSSLFAKIIETERMEDILDEVTKHSVVIFDLDNTIMESAQTLGSDQWFEHRISQLKKQGVPSDEAVQTAVKDWERINRVGNVRLVESSTPGIIEEIQQLGVPTMGLTARPVSFMDKSLEQLQSLEVPLNRRTVSKQVVKIEAQDTAVFKDGLLSVGGNNKGTILVAFLSRIGLAPERVLFVDDKVKNVTNVDAALEATTIASFAFRYGAADWKVKGFDAKLADFQFNYFNQYGILLSDSQAKKLMP